MYLPKLNVVLEPVASVSDQRLAPLRPLETRLQQTVRLASSSPIEVSVQGRTATLRGLVASESEKSMAETLVLFEPGISTVTNQLRVTATSSGIPIDPSR
ncbi:BON domain-containing protein [Crateriforma conspicua]|uniref:BON domain-containing protein n=1 Tax=Crateriforma conspicua TaxID=2527996 RepID=UPI0036F3BC1E